MFALRGDSLSRVDFPSWFVVRKDIRTVKSTLPISKISPPKPHVQTPINRDLLHWFVSLSLKYKYNNIHFLQTSTGYLMTCVIVIIVVMNDVKR